MKKIQIRTAAEQVADFLREELFRGTWTGTMPGKHNLVSRLGVGADTVQEALRLLENMGLLVSQGQGRRRLIQLPKDLATPSLRVRSLHYDKEDAGASLAINIRQWAEGAGHVVEPVSKDLHDLGMNPKRVAEYVSRFPADAWLVFAASRGVIEWFASQPVPTYAVFGNKAGINIAGFGVSINSCLEKVLDRLVGLGHNRIVMLAREERRKPKIGKTEEAFLAGLEERGIKPGSYNLPDWEDNPAGLHARLDSLFKLTPPTAIIAQEPAHYFSTWQHLSEIGILTPKHVSLICIGSDPIFAWCKPEISHFKWDERIAVRNVVKWIENVARGKEDRRQVLLTKSKFVEGGTIGRANPKF